MAKKTVRTTRTVTTSRFVRTCAYIALVISAGIFLFGGLVKWLDWTALTKIANTLDLIGKIALALGVAVCAYDFTYGKKKVWRIIYWVALIVYVLGCVFGLI